MRRARVGGAGHDSRADGYRADRPGLRWQRDWLLDARDATDLPTRATSNTRAPIAQRGKAKQKRTDLRLVGLGLVVTRDGGIPLNWHAYPGDKPDVTQFAGMIDQLTARYQAVCAADGSPYRAADITVVFDAGQNSGATSPTSPRPGWATSGRCRSPTAPTWPPCPPACAPPSTTSATLG